MVELSDECSYSVKAKLRAMYKCIIFCFHPLSLTGPAVFNSIIFNHYGNRIYHLKTLKVPVLSGVSVLCGLESYVHYCQCMFIVLLFWHSCSPVTSLCLCLLCIFTPRLDLTLSIVSGLSGFRVIFLQLSFSSEFCANPHLHNYLSHVKA